MDTQATISIASINLEESHIKVLRFLISYYFKDRFSLTEKKNSKVQILHINSGDANKKFDKYQKRYPDSLFIIISNNDVEESATPVITVPVTPRKLSDALYKISAKLESNAKEENLEVNTTEKNISSKVSSNKKNGKNSTPSKKIVDGESTKPLKIIISKSESKEVIFGDNIKKNSGNSEKKRKKTSDTNLAIKKVNSTALSKKKRTNKSKIEKQRKSIIPSISNTTYTKRIKSIKREISADIYEDHIFSDKADKQEKSKLKAEVESKNTPHQNKESEYDFYSDLDNSFEEMAINSLNKENKTKLINKENKLESTILNKKSNYKKNILITKDKLNFMSSRPDIDLDDTNLVAKINYKPSGYLQGCLNNIYNNPRSNSLDVSYGIIVYNKKNHTASINVNDRTLQNISSIGKLKANYSFIDIKELSDAKEVHWEDADTVLWKVSIWASRGRLPQQFNNIDTKFNLKYWPNLTRFMMTPHAMEIAALWSNRPISLRKTITLLNIPQRYVFSFYSASIALNLINFEKNIPTNKINPQSTKSLIKPKVKRKGVFGKLLKYFKPNNIEEI